MVILVEAKTIGDKVRIIRAARNWSQAGLAAISKVNQMTISRIERNIEVGQCEMKKVLKALDIEC